MGRALRQQVPRRSLGTWEPPADRADPINLLRASHAGRLPELVPIRVARMGGSPYGFLRGAAVVMAADVTRLPATGITVSIDVVDAAALTDYAGIVGHLLASSVLH